MPVKFGMDAAIYYQTDGVAGSAGWVEFGNVRDVTLNLEAGDADVTTRGNNGWRASVPTLKDGTVEFEVVWDTGDAGFTAIKNAFLNKTAIGIRVLDTGTAGATYEGLQADMMVTNFSRSEPLEDAIKASVTLKITYSATAASWVTDTHPSS